MLVAAALAVGAAGGGATAAHAADVRTAEAPARIAVGTNRTLVDTRTGEAFFPRGFNYVRLTPSPARPQNPYHSTFEPASYDPARADAALRRFASFGYNTVRVFIDPGDGQDNLASRPHGLGHGDADQRPADPAYLDNVADFVRKAAQHGVYVLPSLDVFPQNGYYRGVIAAATPPHNVEGRNRSYMYEGYIRAKEHYLATFTSEMKNRLGVLMSTFLALQTDNEAYYTVNTAPFQQKSGTVTVAGRTYDMAVPAQRQAAADDAIVAYADRTVAAVKGEDPALLVTMGAFTNKAVGKTFDGLSGQCGGAACSDPRYPVRMSTLTRDSDLDLFDLHTYLHPNRPIETDLDSMEWSAVEGVVINGEFGALHAEYNLDEARRGLVEHQVTTCSLGISGWLFWTWDTDEDATQRLFHRGNESGEAIGNSLAPASRPDACAARQAHPVTRPNPPLLPRPREGALPLPRPR
ncbi:hypothetical protein GCM10023320_62580 [Pseudonocardia adelaidensis]|uniref:Glycoside hydrolase family 5 domain-containing protein n=1 Tax=Pseudonocardia adelaidensis TaxID=648754 RepID=A0ABP9NZM4_9PSEU